MNFNWPCVGCVGLWHFEDNVLDGSGNNIPSTLSGAVTYSPGRHSQAINFASANQRYITLSDVAALKPLDFTFIVNYKGTMTTRGCILQNYRIDIGGPTHKGYKFLIVSGIPTVQLVNDGGVSDVRTYQAGSVSVADGDWHNIIVTRDSSFLRFYIDFDNVSTYINPAQHGWSGLYGTGGPVIGREIYYSSALTWGYYIGGALDELQILNHALSPSDVNRLRIFYFGE